MNFFLRWLDKYLKVDKVDVRYYLGTGTVEAGERLVTTGARATVVNIDPTSNGHDIAVMKADVSGYDTHGGRSLPSSRGQGNLRHRYPRQGYLEEEAPLNATVKLAMTNGKVMSVDSRPGDWSAYGTDAVFTHGDSAVQSSTRMDSDRSHQLLQGRRSGQAGLRVAGSLSLLSSCARISPARRQCLVRPEDCDEHVLPRSSEADNPALQSELCCSVRSSRARPGMHM